MNVLNILQIVLICFSCQFSQKKQPPAITSQPVDSPQPGAYSLPDYLPLLNGKRVACVVNHSSLVGQSHLIDTLIKAGVNIQIAFAPEHGFRGDAADGAIIESGRDPSTGVRIISLYGEKKKKPESSDLDSIDIVIFDIQDVGARFYTYISTMHYVMEACAENNLPMLILDRPNPNGYYVDGPLMKEGFKSFIGMHEIPIVYGMTNGELARMINGERWLTDSIQCDLTIIPCKQYDHTMTYEIPVAPSPNLPNHRSVLLYPSLCVFEGTHVSVGRGTNTQFQVLGHPAFTQGDYSFTPQPNQASTNPPQKGVLLHGTDLTSLSVEEIKSWGQLNLQWLIEYHRALNPSDQFFLGDGNAFDIRAGSSSLREQLEAGWTEEQIRASWQEDLNAFQVKRAKYLIYP